VTDKIAEFRRINEPRVEKILASLGHIEKSAASMRIDPETFRALIEPIRRHVRGGHEGPRERAHGSSIKVEVQHEPTEIKATPHVSQAGVPYADLPTTQLVDKMIAIGAILAERRK